MIIKPIKTRVFQENEDILLFINEHIKKIPEGSVLVVTSKIIALSEGRTQKVFSVKEKERLIKKESDIAIKTEFVWFSIKDGQLMANAGIDESNGDGKLILLPRDSFVSAEKIRKAVMKKYQLKNLGILITDSRTMPLRAGVIGTTLGYAGFKGIKSYVGKPDIFGKKFKFSRVNIADGLAASAVLCMGEGSERFPLALIENAPVVFCSRINKSETKIALKDDMYLPFLKKFKLK